MFLNLSERVKMQVKLVSKTELSGSLKEELEATSEDLIAYIARVSNPSNQSNIETSERLIRYLSKHKHWSPFEMVDLTVEIKTSRLIATQLLRHRSFSFQEFSQRYSQVTSIESLELRKQATTNRQSSTDLVEDYEAINIAVENHFKNCMVFYEYLLEKGVARECARAVLPLNTSTTLYMKGSLRSWLTFLSVRLHETSQKEIRMIAEAIRDIIKEEFPKVSKAFNGFEGWDKEFLI